MLLSWPPLGTKMAEGCLKHYKGKTIIYVGEHSGGACATDKFFAKLEEGFEKIGEVSLPFWDGMHDHMSIWRRKRCLPKK